MTIHALNRENVLQIYVGVQGGKNLGQEKKDDPTNLIEQQADMGKRVAIGDILCIACLLVFAPTSGKSQDFNAFNTFAPYSANQSFSFQSPPPFEEMGFKTYTADSEPQFDSMAAYRENAYRAFEAMGQPNVQVKEYVGRNYSGFNPMTRDAAQTYKHLADVPYMPYAPFDGLK